MSLLDKWTGGSDARFEPQTLMATPIGLSTPLFLAYYSIASVGAAFWWMNRWTRYTHLESVMAGPVVEMDLQLEMTPAPEGETVTDVVPELEIAAAPVVEAAAEPPVLALAAEAVPEAVAVAAKPKPKPRARKPKATA